MPGWFKGSSLCSQHRAVLFELTASLRYKIATLGTIRLQKKTAQDACPNGVEESKGPGQADVIVVKSKGVVVRRPRV